MSLRSESSEPFLSDRCFFSPDGSFSIVLPPVCPLPPTAQPPVCRLRFALFFFPLTLLPVFRWFFHPSLLSFSGCLPPSRRRLKESNLSAKHFPPLPPPHNRILQTHHGTIFSPHVGPLLLYPVAAVTGGLPKDGTPSFNKSCTPVPR